MGAAVVVGICLGEGAEADWALEEVAAVVVGGEVVVRDEGLMEHEVAEDEGVGGVGLVE